MPRGTIAAPGRKRRGVEDVGQRIDARQLDELVLQAKQPLSRAQPSVQLLSNWRLSDELVGAAVQRVDEVLLIRVGRHQDDVDRALPARQQPGLPAQFEAGHRVDLGAGQQRADRAVRFDAVKCLPGVDKRRHAMAGALSSSRDTALRTVRLGSTTTTRTETPRSLAGGSVV
jgi:hypothetical protein